MDNSKLTSNRNEGRFMIYTLESLVLWKIESFYWLPYVPKATKSRMSFFYLLVVAHGGQEFFQTKNNHLELC